ncbi:MAG TPA: DUF6580 family putative transport protein [Acidobacteriaceae bacterium]|jgi:hypothetical protein|nr:DUF6580 family putative transport protein [Acidobacteriaceae bacterium]
MGAYLLIFAAVLSRVVVMPHLHWLNFTAVGGSLLYFGARRPLREAALPVLAMMASDYCLTVFGYGYSWHTSAYLITWVWYAAVLVLGRILLSRQMSVSRVLGAPVIASTSFFLVSNYAVWVGSVMYPHTLSGLTACYVAALPFYRNDALSTILVTALAFGLPVLARRMAEQRAQKLAA